MKWIDLILYDQIMMAFDGHFQFRFVFRSYQKECKIVEIFKKTNRIKLKKKFTYVGYLLCKS